MIDYNATASQKPDVLCPADMKLMCGYRARRSSIIMLTMCVYSRLIHHDKSIGQKAISRIKQPMQASEVSATAA